MGSDPERKVVSAALRKRLLSLATIVFKPAGTILFRRGDPCAGAFLISKGKIRLALDNIDEIFPPQTLGEGCVIGLPSAVGNSPYTLTADVIEAAELACVPQKALLECLQCDPQLCFEVMSMLSHEVASARSFIKHGAKAPRPNHRR